MKTAEGSDRPMSQGIQMRRRGEPLATTGRRPRMIYELRQDLPVLPSQLATYIKGCPPLSPAAVLSSTTRLQVAGRSLTFRP